MSKRKKSIGIHELYTSDPIKADRELWGRESDPETRRGFLRKAGLTAMSVALGGKIAFAEKMPAGLIPIALASPQADFALQGKHPDLIVLNDRPWNVETPAHLLDDPITPADKFFVRNNGNAPEKIDIDRWTLTIDGESVPEPVTLTLNDLKTKFKPYTYRLTLECGGNGRAEFNPPAKGNQWTTGAVSCAEWTGVRLRDVLEFANVKSDAVYVGYYGADIHLSGNPDKVVISRGVPIDKAMEDEALLAFAMNGSDIPLIHGHPLRMVIGGWPASVSGKWLTRLAVRNKVHDGPKMEAPAYRVPKYPVEPGSEVNESDMVIMGSMPVKSLITYPKSGAKLKRSKQLQVRGHAWAGDLEVTQMQVSIDYGATWISCVLNKPHNRMAWQQWSAKLQFPEPGYYEVWAKATDENGRSQPMVVPGWNPKGYNNNATHRIAVMVEQ
jgi:DMSO/TMAO reductase YedYZ molybdopterin-dependent catalytic subunit